MWDLFLSQITDIFRIGLLIGLLYTARRTAAATGTLIPLLAGIVFVAVIIPTTQGRSGGMEMLVGVVSNAVLVGVMLAAVTLYTRLRAQ